MSLLLGQYRHEIEPQFPEAADLLADLLDEDMIDLGMSIYNNLSRSVDPVRSVICVATAQLRTDAATGA